MNLTTEKLDRLADLGAAAANYKVGTSLLSLEPADPSYDEDAPARRVFVQAVLDNLPENDTDWPLTRNAFASRGITTDEAAADWVSITHDTRTAKPALTFGEPPAGWDGWHNPQGLTPEQVGVADGWRLCLREEKACLQDEKYERLGWAGYPAMRGCTFVYKELEPTYRTKAPLPDPRTPEQIEHTAFLNWYESATDSQRLEAAIHGWRTLSPCKPTNS